MHHNCILDTLQNLTNHKPSQQELANILQVSINTIGGRARRNSNYSAEELKTIGDFYSVDLLNRQNILSTELVPDTSETITADFYENIEVSCGGGICTLNETKKAIPIPKECVSNYASYKKYSVVRAVSDSMIPLINPKDYLIIEDCKEIENNKVYVFLYGDTLYCKNLSNNIGQVIIRSYNKDYPIRYVEGEDLNNINIIGKVVGIMRDID